MIWAKEETMSRAEIEAIQLKRLKETVRRVYEKVEPYRRKMEEAGIKPEDIRTLKDLEKLPFTTKQDMRDNYPYGLFAVPLKKLRRIHASSGTTGKPTVVGYTEQDLEVWKECVARLAAAAAWDRGRHCSNLLWLWDVYRGPGTPLRPGKAGGGHHSLLHRKYTEAADVYEGLRRYPAGGYALLRHAHRGGGKGNRNRPKEGFEG